jgi:hypothetical protein
MDDYDGRQVVGMDLHRRPSPLVRMTEDGRRLGTARIINSPAELFKAVGVAGSAPAGHELALARITAVHMAAWLSIESCMLYVVYAGFAGRSDRRAAIAAGVVAAETLVFAGNGFRCPLTDVAEHLGTEQASVTDIHLPRWFAHNLPAIHVPLILLAAFLHGNNIRRARGAGVG